MSSFNFSDFSNDAVVRIKAEHELKKREENERRINVAKNVVLDKINQLASGSEKMIDGNPPMYVQVDVDCYSWAVAELGKYGFGLKAIYRGYDIIQISNEVDEAYESKAAAIRKTINNFKSQRIFHLQNNIKSCMSKILETGSKEERLFITAYDYTLAKDVENAICNTPFKTIFQCTEHWGSLCYTIIISLK